MIGVKKRKPAEPSSRDADGEGRGLREARAPVPAPPLQKGAWSTPPGKNRARGLVRGVEIPLPKRAERARSTTLLRTAQLGSRRLPSEYWILANRSAMQQRRVISTICKYKRGGNSAEEGLTSISSLGRWEAGEGESYGLEADATLYDVQGSHCQLEKEKRAACSNLLQVEEIIVRGRHSATIRRGSLLCSRERRIREQDTDSCRREERSASVVDRSAVLAQTVSEGSESFESYIGKTFRGHARSRGAAFWNASSCIETGDHVHSESLPEIGSRNVLAGNVFLE